MSQKTPDDIRESLRDLIREAVSETGPGRRRGLLTLADHWGDILRRRAEAGSAKAVT